MQATRCRISFQPWPVSEPEQGPELWRQLLLQALLHCLQQVFQTSTLTLNLELAPTWLPFARCAYAASFPLGKGVCLQEGPNLSFDGKDRATGFGLSHVPASSQVVCIFQLKIIQAFVDLLWQGLEKLGWRDPSHSVTGGCKCFALSNKAPFRGRKGL